MNTVRELYSKLGLGEALEDDFVIVSTTIFANYEEKVNAKIEEKLKAFSNGDYQKYHATYLKLNEIEDNINRLYMKETFYKSISCFEKFQDEFEYCNVREEENDMNVYEKIEIFCVNVQKGFIETYSKLSEIEIVEIRLCMKKAFYKYLLDWENL